MDTEGNAATENLKTSEKTDPSLEELERQVERGYLFAHSVLGESSLKLGEVQVFLHGLTDTLLKKGLVTPEEITSAMTTVRHELTERGELNGPRTVVRVDQDVPITNPPVKVDCQARMHICHAVCCKLNFALSVPEVESGKIKWDLGRPYYIRHDGHGSCTHLDPQLGGCRIYADRPGVCRGYSCANDSRIWKDFEKMELNSEWIETNLSVTDEPQLVRAVMHDPKYLTEATIPSSQK